MGIDTSIITQVVGDTRELVIDLKAIYQNLFGYTPATIDVAAYNAKLGASQPNDASIPTFTKKATTVWGSNLYGYGDMLGRPLFCPIVFQYYSNRAKAQIKLNLPCAVVEVKLKRILKETPMVERGGVVIEEVSLDAVRINIQGFLVGQYGQFPDNELDALNDLWTNTNPVSLINPLTDLFLKKDDTVIISDLSFPSNKGVEGVKPFSMDVIENSILDLYTIK